MVPNGTIRKIVVDNIHMEDVCLAGPCPVADYTLYVWDNGNTPAPGLPIDIPNVSQDEINDILELTPAEHYLKATTGSYS